MKYLITPILIILVGFAFSSQCTAQNKPENEDLLHQIYLLGNTGIVKRQPNYPVLNVLREQLEEDSRRSSVIFLGNLLPRNVLPEGARDIEKYLAGETYYKNIEKLKDTKSKFYVIPGPIEWFFSKKSSHVTIRNVEKIIQNLFDDKVFLPNKGCPGPEEVEIDDHTVLIFIDTQWWLNREKENLDWENLECEIQSAGDLLVQLHDVLLEHKDKHIIIAGYHPLLSYGIHNGYLPGYTHAAPPIFGSVYYLYRNWIGKINDFANPTYSAFVKGLKSILQSNKNVIYVSSHELSLQYIREGNLHQLISGSSVEGRHVKKTTDFFTSSERGFMKLKFFENGEAWLEVWKVDDFSTAEKLTEKRLYQFLPDTERELEIGDINFTGLTIDTLASNAYGNQKKKPGIMGLNYRKEWRQVVRDIPYIDIQTTKGGLRPKKRGGGMQTRSLRLENDKDQEYVLRSVEKFPEAAVPSDLRKTIVADLVKDFISSSHPYAAYVIPSLADAVGVYHTNPKLVYLPDDPSLGVYRDDFAKGLYLFEERPMNEFDDLASFGKPEDIIGTDELIESILDDNELYVDQHQVLQSRLFDMWIGDWDRHEDQWRWAEFKEIRKNKFYQAIPRDRDQAFFYNDGLLIKYGTRQPSLAKFQGFDYKIRDIKGMNYNARHFDRTFLTEPDWNDWESTTRFMQQNLTDSVINSAINEFPDEIYQHSGEKIIAKLKRRRDDLVLYAKEYYEFLSKNVNVVGSDEEEWFDVERVSDNQTKVTVWDLKQKSEKPDRKMYERIFKTDVTDEIRLYGMGDEDRFTISGNVRKGIKLRVIGGYGDDELEDFSSVKGLSKKTIVYDNVGGIEVKSGKELKSEISNEPGVNTFNRQSFNYNFFTPLIYIDISPDDGIFFTGEVKFFAYGFRKHPYKSMQNYSLSYSPVVNSFKFKYEGDFIRAIGNWDLNISADIKYPTYTDYYYGLGNETAIDEEKQDEEYYQFRYASIDIRPLFIKSFQQRTQYFLFGPIIHFYRLNESKDEERKYLEDFPAPDHDDLKFFTGIRAGYIFDSRDSKSFPKYGIYWSTWVSRIYEVNNDSIQFNNLQSQLSFYQSTGGSLNTTLAARVGGAFNDGNYRFYQSNDLGGKTNLRGHRRMRFSGDKMLFVNLEARIRLFRFNMPLFPGSFGIYGFFDSGRVWYKNGEGIDPSTVSGSSNIWHAGYGGGIWVAPLRKFVFSADLSTSTTDQQLLINLRYGFFF